MIHSYCSINIHRQRGTEFIKRLINAEPTIIPDSGGMQVLPNILMLETNKIVDIVIRTITEPFWNACIDILNSPGQATRVAVVGNPGIGKTAITPILIRNLLRMGRIVVYII